MSPPESFPSGARPGQRIEWRESRETRAGVVIDRAANGVSYYGEQAGVWLWVIPDEGAEVVRVRYIASGARKGQAWREDGPMWCRVRRVAVEGMRDVS